MVKNRKRNWKGDVKMEIKVENGNLMVVIPLEEINNTEDKEKIGAKVGDELTTLMQWIEDKEFRTKRTFGEKEYNQLIELLFNGHTIDIKNI